MQQLKIIVICSFFVSLSHCTVGPTYETPVLQSPAPDAWHNAVSNDFSTDSADISDWWYRFDDPFLVSLIAEAQQSNISLKIAISNLLQARSAYGVAASKLVPDVTAKGSAQRKQGSDNSPGLANYPALQSSPTNDVSVGLDASWEIDLWGGIAKNIEAASATVGAELEQYRDTLITIRAEVASTYINIRVLQVKKLLSTSYVDAQFEILSLNEEKFDQGLLTRIEIAQVRALYNQVSTMLPEVDASLVQEISRLAVLLGTDYETAVNKITLRSSVPRASPMIAVGIPTDIIRRRPDIRAAERALAAQTALVGSKMSNLYPKLSLSGSFGYEATESNELLRWDSRSYSFGPSVSWDLFNGDRIRSQIQMQEEKMNEAYLNWELTVLNAFGEVEILISNLVEDGKIQDSLGDASDSMLVSFLLTEEKAREGVQDKQSVLQIKQNFINVQLDLVEQTGVVSQQIIALYKALGGDWENNINPEITSNEQARITQ